MVAVPKVILREKVVVGDEMLVLAVVTFK